jgi:hypothetical protein
VVCISGATEHSMLFRASERLTATRRTRDRSSGAVLALSVQTLFVLLIVFSSSRLAPPRSPAHETILLLHPLPQTAPRNIDARGAVLHRAPPVAIPILPTIAPRVLAPPSGIAGFGRSLFGCAPEHYADLPPDEKAHCPKPGEGMAVNQPPDLLNPPKSHAKDEALWQEKWAEDHWVPAVCPPGDGPGAVVHCLLEQSIAENRRRQAAWQKIADDTAAALQEPKRPVPRIGVRRN